MSAHEELCVVCLDTLHNMKNRSTTTKRLKKIKNQDWVEFFLHDSASNSQAVFRVVVGASICNKCYMKAYKSCGSSRSSSESSADGTFTTSESDSSENTSSTSTSVSETETESATSSESEDADTRNSSSVDDFEDNFDGDGEAFDNNDNSPNYDYSDTPTIQGVDIDNEPGYMELDFDEQMDYLNDNQNENDDWADDVNNDVEMADISSSESSDESSESSDDSSESSDDSSENESNDGDNDSEYVPSEIEEEDDDPPEQNNLEDTRYTRSGHMTCLFGCSPPLNLSTVPVRIRTFCLIQSNTYIPFGSRCCASHLVDDLDEWVEVPTVANCDINDYKEGMRLLRRHCQHNDNFAILIKRPTEAASKFYKIWTGIKPQQFCELMRIVNLSLTDVNIKYMVMTLMKFRVNLSFVHLASLVDCSPSNAKTRFRQNLQLLYEKFVPLYLGLNNMTRELCLSHKTYIAKHLFNVPDDKLIVIADGTYIFIQKSMNAEAQRNAYTDHKKRPLFKPFVLVAPDGYILDIVTNFSAKDNDAKVMMRVISSAPGRALFQDGDFFILDRGFRDCMPFLAAKGFKAFMPQGAPGRAQMTTEAANASRKVCKIRCSVEQVNGHMKSIFRIFHHTQQNSSLSNMLPKLKVCGALYNAFFARLETDRGYQEEIVTQMLVNEDKPNLLADLCNNDTLNRLRVQFCCRTIEEVSLWFPTFNIDELYFFAQGTYQLKYVGSYFADAINRVHPEGFSFESWEDSAELDLSRWGDDLEEPILVRTKVPSHHSAHKIYKCYFLLDISKTGREMIVEYFCSCIQGRRTMGCCGHIMAVLYYATIGWQQNPAIPAKHLIDFAKRLPDIDDYGSDNERLDN